MTDAERLAFVRRVLAAFDRCDMHSDLWWRTGERYGGRQYDDPATFLVDCSDTFWWGTADCEEVTPENVGLLEQTFADLRVADGPGATVHIGDLFAARIRKMRPQGACYAKRYAPKLWPLFDACGPERKVGLGNPYPRPDAPEEAKR